MQRLIVLETINKYKKGIEVHAELKDLSESMIKLLNTDDDELHEINDIGVVLDEIS